MMMFLIPALLAAATPAALNSAQSEQVRCVAALAIVAHDQQSGGSDWANLPPLAKRGAHFSGTVGEVLMKTGGFTRDQVRGLIVEQVAQFQKAVGQQQIATGESLPRLTVTSCIALMDKVDPPAPPPTLPRCAAALALAYDDTHRREGLSKSAKDLATFAAVLDSRAREELRAGGKSEGEGDEVIGLAREALIADAKAGKEGPDIEQCFELAKP
jgi:hypothetical protein